MTQTVAEVLSRLPHPDLPRLEAPAYTGTGEGMRVGLAVESMKRHVTSEGWELFAGLERHGYRLYGHNLPRPQTDVRVILELERPGVVFLQDAREFLGLTAGKNHDPRERFTHLDALGQRPDVFTLTFIKDAHRDHGLHQQTAREIGCHAWVTPYCPEVICRLAPFVRKEHLIRTYHTVDPGAVPPYSPHGRKGCLLSGAMNKTVYPLRYRLAQEVRHLDGCEVLPHPGYHRGVCRTPDYLRTLSRYKAAICTSSIYGYALRKIVEATAAGCTVLTNLAETLPEVDGNLVRIGDGWPTNQIAGLLREVLENYDPERQQHYAERCVQFYGYRACGLRLARDIEAMRKGYPCR